MATMSKNPNWWNDSHSSSWDRAKEALRRDWEQTKADVSDGGRELNQDVGDTVKQALGKQPIPPGNVPNREDSGPSFGDWDSAEPAVRYGYGARHYYSTDSDWNDELERKLRRDWESTGNQSAWDRVKNAVRRGWESVTQKNDA
jgi:hypothetical protein